MVFCLLVYKIILLGADNPGDTCTGDSGGGLECDGKISGIVSFGIGCGNIGVPHVYVNTKEFLSWIENSTYSFRKPLMKPFTLILIWINIIYQQVN